HLYDRQRGRVEADATGRYLAARHDEGDPPRSLPRSRQRRRQCAAARLARDATRPYTRSDAGAGLRDDDLDTAFRSISDHDARRAGRCILRALLADLRRDVPKPSLRHRRGACLCAGNGNVCIRLFAHPHARAQSMSMELISAGVGIRLARKLARNCLLALLSILLVLYVAGPVAWLLSSSFKTESEITAKPPSWVPKQPTGGNYTAIFDSGSEEVTYENRRQGDAA